MSRTAQSLPLRLLRSQPQTALSRPSSPLTITRCFATSEVLHMPREKQPRGNIRRGMSAMRGKGIPPWIKLSVTEADLKTPRKIRPNAEELVDFTHGLWGFFNKEQLLTPPEEISKHGLSSLTTNATGWS
jgi:hypothetical protein